MAAKAITSFIVLLLALNHWGWQVNALGLASGLTYLALASYLLGGRFGRMGQGTLEQLAWGAGALAALFSVLGCGALYLWQLTPEVIFGIAAVAPWLGTSQRGKTSAAEPRQRWVVALGLIYLALAALTVTLIAETRTVEAIRTPWQVVSAFVFVSYALTAAAFLVLARQAKNPAWLVPIFFVSVAVLGLVYPLGYGFDPFIHQASEKLIQASGTISPKPPYYLGQYALVVALSHLLRLPVVALDTWILPLLAALTAPFAAQAALSELKVTRPWVMALPLVLMFGFTSSFTYTTPQGLANLFALLAVLLMATRALYPSLPQKTIWLFALAALAAHPLTGLPLVGLVLLWWMTFEHVTMFGRQQNLARGIASVATVFVVPIGFVVLSWLKPGAASLKFTGDFLGQLARVGSDIRATLPALPRFADAGDAVELVARPLTLVLVVLAVLGWRYARGEQSPIRFFAFAAALPTASYLAMALMFTFPNLPANEQHFYTERLWTLALMFSIPLVLLGTYAAATWTERKLPSYVPIAIAGSLLLTIAFYLAYPRFDRWQRDTAYNTTPADVTAVKLIQETSGGLPYVVLANQAVAAAAIGEYGFARYYQGNFYYPLPTGTNPLYSVYLHAAERGTPTRDVIEAAATAMQVPQVYLVLNRYWANFLKLAPIAQREANQYWLVADDRVQVYRYDF